MKETDLYAPVKTLLEAQGYEVKGEIGKCDVMGVRGDEDPVIVELKTGVTIGLVLQGVDRLALSDKVYIAVPKGKTKSWRKTARDVVKLCRRVGLGFIVISNEVAEVMLDPLPYQPRKNKRRKDALLREFTARRGDPNKGGTTRAKIITAYRQEAIRIAEHLAEYGPAKPAELKRAVGAEKAGSILAKNHYGWFVRVEHGVYDLTPEHRALLET